MILLDTNIVVAFLNGHNGIARRIADRFLEVAIPSLVAAELYYGARASLRVEDNVGKLDQLCHIAAIALAQEATLVTHDTRDFQDISGLRAYPQII